MIIFQGENAKLSVVHEIGKAPHHEEEEEEDAESTAEAATESTEMDEEPAEQQQEPEQDEGESSEDETNAEEAAEAEGGDDAAAEEEGDDDNQTGGGVGESLLELLTGQPVADDTLMFALPFCAPYSALTKYKYKAKLIPGTQKRGKSRFIH